MKFIAASFFSLQPLMQSSKEKKAKEKRSHYSVIDWAKRIKRQLMENIIKCSYPKMTGQNDRPDESLTGQVHDQAGHCPLTGRYFEPCSRHKQIPTAKPKLFCFRCKVFGFAVLDLPWQLWATTKCIISYTAVHLKMKIGVNTLE